MRQPLWQTLSDSAPDMLDRDDIADRHLRCISAAADFARNEFLEIDRAQMRLRILCVSTGGIIASILFSLFFAKGLQIGYQIVNAQTVNLNEDQAIVVGLLAIALSFFYAMIGLIYVNLSGRRSSAIHYLVDEVPSYIALLDEQLSRNKGHLHFQVDQARPFPFFREISKLMWRVQSVCIFIIPCLLCLAVWPLLTVRYDWQIISWPMLANIPYRMYSQHIFIYWVYSLTTPVVLAMILAMSMLRSIDKAATRRHDMQPLAWLPKYRLKLRNFVFRVCSWRPRWLRWVPKPLRPETATVTLCVALLLLGWTLLVLWLWRGLPWLPVRYYSHTIAPPPCYLC
jgi:hypothetical protein